MDDAPHVDLIRIEFIGRFKPNGYPQITAGSKHQDIYTFDVHTRGVDLNELRRGDVLIVEAHLRNSTLGGFKYWLITKAQLVSRA